MRHGALVMGVWLALALACAAGGKIIYVDNDAPPGGDGKSWATAYRYLQDALQEAKSPAQPTRGPRGGVRALIAGGSDPNDGPASVEIRVAQGVYKPDQGMNQTSGDRRASFELNTGVRLKGGYAGLGVADPNAREIELYRTTLNGDLAGDDVLSEDPTDFVADPNDGVWDRPKVWNLLIESTRRENSVHVLVADGTDQTAVLDGFTVTGGNAYHPPYWFGRDAPLHFDENDLGGGLLNDRASPMLKSCTFMANSAIGSSGAMYNKGPCQPIILDCRFLDNFSWSGGGAIESRGANVVMTGCLFERNEVWGGGAAAMFSWDSDLSLVECRFASSGFVGTSFGTVYSVGGRGVFTQCEFEHNVGDVAVNNGQTEATLNACDFVGNSGGNGGGFQSGNGTKARLNNCRFVLNRAGQGGGALHQLYEQYLPEKLPVLWEQSHSRRWSDILSILRGCDSNKHAFLGQSVPCWAFRFTRAGLRWTRSFNCQYFL